MGKRKANARLRHACNTLLMGILVCIVGVFGARMLESGAPAAEAPGAEAPGVEAAGAETPAHAYTCLLYTSPEVHRGAAFAVNVRVCGAHADDIRGRSHGKPPANRDCQIVSIIIPVSLPRRNVSLRRQRKLPERGGAEREPVSYTHRDVYKRQPLGLSEYAGWHHFYL